VIEVEKLHKYYDGGLIEALKGISLSFLEGEVCAIMGPSGCGKSTLLNLIGALDCPTKGRVVVAGKVLGKPASLFRYRSRQVGFIFQFHNLIPSLTLLENIELPAFAGGRLQAVQGRKQALALLDEVGLAAKADCRPTAVAGGERQRAAVARALVNRPRILLADEPTGSVDSETAVMIMQAILERCQKNGMTALIATHNPEIAAQCDRVVTLRDGRVRGDSVVE
jgi:putative ABC transport system ATP-binding protein